MQTDDAEVRARIENDFAFFVREELPNSEGMDFEIRALRLAPDASRLPDGRASVYTPRNICYSDSSRTWMDYFGKALAVYDRRAGVVEATTTDAHLLTEIVYLTILSRVSELLEERGLHRVHALAIERNGEAALFLMPSGCGKSTLALQLLQSESDLRILAEDSPFVDAQGRVHPFPLRIGVLGDVPRGIDPKHVTEQRRMEFAPKRLISLDAFPGRFAAEPARARLVFLGHRHTRPGCRFQPATTRTTWKELARHMIIGVGLYQGVEFLLSSSLRDLVQMRRRMVSRVRAAHALTRAADIFELDLGPGPEANARSIVHELRALELGCLSQPPEPLEAAQKIA